MSVLSMLSQLFRFSGTSANGSAVVNPVQIIAPELEPLEIHHRHLCRFLKLMYLSNGMYEDMRRQNMTLVGQEIPPQLKSIRNPVPAVVDFFGAKLLPRPLDFALLKEDKKIEAAIRSVLAASNWEENGPLFSRLDALIGEVYLKVAVRRDLDADGEPTGDAKRVYLEVIDAEYVTDFDRDERGYLTMVRLDIPRFGTRADGTRGTKTYTEIWRKLEGDVRYWENDGNKAESQERDLGDAIRTDTLAEMGIDFIPISRAIFKTIGGKRAIGAVELAIEPVIDADLSATNLHSLVFTELEGSMVLRSEGFDSTGRELPAPQLDDAMSEYSEGLQADGSLTLGKRRLFTLPGATKLEQAIADIDYAAGLAILQDHDGHLQQSMPALAYSKISELTGGDLSGRAIRFKLSAAVDQTEEARANALGALAQALKQAVTIGAHTGVPGFEGLENAFDTGALDLEWKEQDIIPVSDFERSQTELQRAQALGAAVDAGLPLGIALQRIYDYTEKEAAEIVALRAGEVEAADDSETAPEVDR